MARLYSTQGYDDYVRGLLHFSAQVTTATPRIYSHSVPSRSEAVQGHDELPLDTVSSSVNPSYSTSSLRPRDAIALHHLFSHDSIAEIETDICQHLQQLYPEPAWDVEPYEFLREFL